MMRRVVVNMKRKGGGGMRRNPWRLAVVLMLLVLSISLAACTEALTPSGEQPTTGAPTAVGATDSIASSPASASVAAPAGAGGTEGSNLQAGAPISGPEDFALVRATVLSTDGIVARLRIDDVLNIRRGLDAGWAPVTSPDEVLVSVSIAKVVPAPPQSQFVGLISPEGSGGLLVPPIAADGNQIPPEATSGDQGEPIVTGGGQIPPESTGGLLVPPIADDGNQVPPQPTSGDQVIVEGTVGDQNQVPPIVAVGGEIPPEGDVDASGEPIDTGSGQVPPETTSTGTAGQAVEVNVADISEEGISGFIESLVGKTVLISMKCAGPDCSLWFDGRIHEIVLS